MEQVDVRAVAIAAKAVKRGEQVALSAAPGQPAAERSHEHRRRPARGDEGEAFARSAARVQHGEQRDHRHAIAGRRKAERAEQVDRSRFTGTPEGDGWRVKMNPASPLWQFLDSPSANVIICA
jgi:hypothetical protein